MKSSAILSATRFDGSPRRRKNGLIAIKGAMAADNIYISLKENMDEEIVRLNKIAGNPPFCFVDKVKKFDPL